MLATMVAGLFLPFFPVNYAIAQEMPPPEPVDDVVAVAEVADTPIPVVTEPFNLYTFHVGNGLIHWEWSTEPPLEVAAAAEEGANDAQVNPQAPVVPADVAALGDYYMRRKPTGGGPTTTLGVADLWPNGWTFKMMTPDSDGVVYFDPAAGALEPGVQSKIIFLPSGNPGSQVVVATPNTSTSPTGMRFATDADYVYWNTPTSVVRARKDGTTTTPELVADGLVNDLGDLLVVGNTLYVTRGYGTGTGHGLFRIPTTGAGACPQPAGPCAEVQLSPYGGNNLVAHTHTGITINQSRSQIYWSSDESIRVYSCSSILALPCTDTAAVSAPADALLWYFGRTAFSGNTMFFISTNSGPGDTGELRRRADNGTGLGDTIATNLYSSANPVYTTSTDVYFPDYKHPNYTLYKLPLTASVITRDLRADNIEVTQGIQNLANSAPLAAKKATFVRAYGSNAIGPVASAVSVKLYGTRNGNPLPGSPLSPQNGTRSLAVGAVVDRARLNDGWLFQLPSSWVTTGAVSLRLVVDPGMAYSDSNRTNNEKSVNVSFQNQPPACAVYVPVDTHEPTTSPNMPNFWDMVGRFQKMWPVPSVLSGSTTWQAQETEVCWWGPFPHPCGGPFELNEGASISDWIPDKDEAIAVLWAYSLVHYMPACDNAGGYTHYMGLVHPSAPTGTTAGYASTISSQSWVKLPPATPNPFPTRWDSMFQAGVMAQELAHNFGRKHVNCPSGTPDTDGSYPYPPCQIAPTGQDSYYGFDSKTLTPIAPNAAKDYMSYSGPAWTSDYTWRAIMNSVAAQASAAATPDMSLIVSQDGTVIASGFVDTVRTLGQLNNVKVMPAGSMSASMAGKLLDVATAAWAPHDGVDAAHGSEPHVDAFHIQLLNAAGAVLADRAITLVSIDDHDATVASHLFAASFPAPAGEVARVRLLADDLVLDEYVVGTASPVVSISSPASGSIVADSMTVNWNATDADGDTLLFNLQYTYDNGVHWQALVGDLYTTPEPANSITLTDLSGLHGSATNAARVRVIASDGYNTTIAVSAPFTLNYRKPVPFISDPGAGQVYDPQQPMGFHGGASDAEDGALEEGSLTWKVDGAIVGTGADILVNGIVPGAHTVTLEAKDSHLQTATATTTMQVSALSIPQVASGPALDGVCDDAAYVNGSQVLLSPYADASQASVRLVRDANYLYACFTGLITSTAAAATVGLRFDVNNSGGGGAAADDYAFLVTEGGGVLTRAGGGAGVMNEPGPGGLQAQVSLPSGSSTWSAELRIEKAKVGDWGHLVRMAAGYYNVMDSDDDYAWPWLPAEADEGTPDTWGTTALGLLPIITWVNPISATVGSGAMQLVVEGDYMAANPTVLFNGTPYTPVTNAVVQAVDANEDGTVDAAEASDALAVSASTVLTVEIPASEFAAAGVKNLVVRNPGPFDSAAVALNVNNMQPAITSLSPTSRTAGDATFVLTVNGSNFVNGAVVMWDGVPLPTTFSAANKLTAQVNASLMTLGKNVGITVANPAPAVADSNAKVFTVVADAEFLYLPAVANE